eukprot:scaffold129327_cov24-Tisochrysis_lutea.AAC.1
MHLADVNPQVALRVRCFPGPEAPSTSCVFLAFLSSDAHYAYGYASIGSGAPPWHPCSKGQGANHHQQDGDGDSDNDNDLMENCEGLLNDNDLAFDSIDPSPAQMLIGSFSLLFPCTFDGAAVSKFYQMVRCSDESSFAELLHGLKSEFAWLEESMDPT